MLFKNNWKKAYKIANDLSEQNKYKEASYYFINALAKAPGEIQIIKNYADTLFKLVTVSHCQGDIEEAFRQFEWLEMFLMDRLTFVRTEDVPQIIDLASNYAKNKTSLFPTPEDFADPEEKRLEEKLNQYKNNKLAENTKLEEFEELREYLDTIEYEDEEGLLEQLDLKINIKRNDQQARKLLEEGKALMSLSKELNSSSEKAYCLQICENIIRQLVVQKTLLNDQIKIEIDKLLKDLSEASKNIVDKSREEESKIIWDKFENDNNDNLRLIRTWSFPESLRSSLCQGQLDRIQKVILNIQKTVSQLTHNDYSDKASELIEQLSKFEEKANISQQKSYNEWAISNLKSAMQKGTEYVKTVKDDKAGIGETLIKYLAKIEPRFLTQEVQRIYSEVFEYLFNKLKKPKDEEDFEDNVRKLKVLKDMYDIPKKQLKDY